MRNNVSKVAGGRRLSGDALLADPAVEVATPAARLRRLEEALTDLDACGIEVVPDGPGDRLADAVGGRRRTSGEIIALGFAHGMAGPNGVGVR